MKSFTAFLAKRSFALSATLTVVLFAANAIASPGFLDGANFPVQLVSFAPLALAALASMPSILSGGGGIDISVGPSMSLVNVVLVVYLLPSGLPPLVMILIVMGMAAFIGLLNGFLVGYLRYPPIIATLCIFFILQGVLLKAAPSTQQATPGNWTTLLSSSFGPMPWALVLIGMPVLLWALLRRTPLPAAIYSVGGNDGAAFSAGVPVNLTRLLAYGLGGLIAGLGGIALTALIQSADASLATNYTLLAIAAVALGGAALGGGRGGVTGTLLGACAIYLLQTFLAGIHVPATTLGFAYGVLLIAALIFGSLISRGSNRSVAA